MASFPQGLLELFGQYVDTLCIGRRTKSIFFLPLIIFVSPGHCNTYDKFERRNTCNIRGEVTFLFTVCRSIQWVLHLLPLS